MAISTLAIAAGFLRKPLEDLYALGKGKFDTELKSWINDAKAKQLAQKVLVYDKVRTLWQKSKDVRISQIYYAPQIKFSEEAIKPIDSLAKLPVAENYVIEGTVGQGKSIFLRYLCLQELKEKGTGRIPVFIELRTIEKHESLDAAIKACLENFGFLITQGLYEFYLESGKIVILLDGFDELPSKHILGVMEELDSLSVKYPMLQIIVTSRPDRDIQKSCNFTVARIAPLTKDDFEPFLTKIKVPSELRKQLIQALSVKDSKVSGLITTPLMLTLAAYVYRAEREIPADLPQFFEILFQTVFTAHDKSKIAFTRECKSGLEERSLQRLFECFCFSGIKSGHIRSLKPSQFEKAYNEAIQFSTNVCKLSEFKHDVVNVACLMQAEGFDTTFIHQSVQEYYAASFIKHCYDKTAESFYSTLGTTERYKLYHWYQVLNFLQLIDEYRWAKFYKLPLLMEAKDTLEKITDIKSALPIFEGCEIGIDRELSKGFLLSAFTTFHSNNLIAELLEDIMFGCIERQITKEVVLPLLDQDRKKLRFKYFDESEDALNLAQILPKIDTSNVLRKINTFNAKIVREINVLQKVINLEESKGIIFNF